MTSNGTKTGAAAFDMEEARQRLEEMRAQAGERRRAERVDLLAALRALGVARVEVAYDGYADSGNIGGIATVPAEADIAAIRERLGDFAWDTVCHLNPGFEIDDGGEGTLAWEVAEDRIEVAHAAFHTARDEYLHEDVE